MILGFTTQRQILDNWCWAAVASSISRFYDPNSSWIQSAIAANLIDSTCGVINTTNVDTAPPACNAVMDLAAALGVTQNFMGQLPRQLAFSEIVTEINAQAPVCCQIIWPGATAAHFITIYGYNSNQGLIIGDPEAGIFTVDYSTFCGGYRGGSWSQSYGTKPV